MASEMILNQKKEYVAKLAESLKGAQSGILVDYRGTTVADDTKLRRDMRENGVTYGIVKNTLLRFAFNEIGYNELDEHLEGTTAIAYSDDAIAPARVLANFAKDHENFKIKGGFVEGKVVPLEQIMELSKLSSKNALIAQVLGGFNATIASLAICINAIVEKQGAPAAEAAE